MSFIKVLDYSKAPGARYKDDGDDSGEEYFELVLDKAFQTALQNGEKLTVDLDGTSGYASSFLSEAFGLLSEKYGAKTVDNNIIIKSDEEPDWKEAILTDYIPNAKDRKKKDVQ